MKKRKNCTKAPKNRLKAPKKKLMKAPKARTTRTKIGEIVNVSQKKLHRIASEKGSIRMGSTIQPRQRARAYQSPSGGGYSGTMYVAPTENMMKAEDKLLKSKLGRHNVQSISNAQEEPGHVYAIQGKKSSN